MRSSNALIKFCQSSPVTWPENTAGDWSIRHKVYPAGATLDIIGMRAAILTGAKPIKLHLVSDWTVRELRNGDGIVMSDHPHELADHYPFYKAACGNVLVGGLGLGYIAAKLSEKRIVKQITVVEKEADVIKLVAPFMSEKIAIIHGDLFEYLRKNPDIESFDCAYYDIWTGTNEGTWVDNVVPLRRLTAGRAPKLPVWCWQEDTMRGQIRQSCYSAAGIPERLIFGWLPHYVFREGLKQMKIETRVYEDKCTTAADVADLMAVHAANRENREMAALAEIFINDVGHPHWEKVFGKAWDEYLETKKEKSDEN